jgi:hypothetical protein
MVIEKTVVENNRYSVDLNNYVSEGELTVTITLGEYRDLIKTSVENKQRKEHESWSEQYSRANKAEERVKELEAEVSNLYKRLAENKDDEGEENDA